MATDEALKRRAYARKWQAAMRTFRDGMNQLFLLDMEMNNADLVFVNSDFEGAPPVANDLSHVDAVTFEASRTSFGATKTFVTGAGNHHKKFDKIL